MAKNRPITDQVLASIPFWELSADDAVGPDQLAVADGHSYNDARAVTSEGAIDSWHDLASAWKSASTPPHDVLLAVDTVPLYSPRVSDVIDAHLGPADHVPWLPATVRTPDGDEHRYGCRT